MSVATIGIDFWVGDIHVAPDDLVARVRTGRLLRFAASHVVVIYIAMNAAVAVQIVIIHAPLSDIPVDLDVSVIVVDVDVGDVNIRAAASDPATTLPAVIVNTMAGPVPVTVEPSPDGESNTKGYDIAQISVSIS